MGEEGTITLKRRRHTPEQVIRKLREADRLLGEGKTIPEVARALEVSENTYHRWRNQFGGMKADGAKRLKERYAGGAPAPRRGRGRSSRRPWESTTSNKLGCVRPFVRETRGLRYATEVLSVRP